MQWKIIYPRESSRVERLASGKVRGEFDEKIVRVETL